MQLRNELAFQMYATLTQFYRNEPLSRHKIPKLLYSFRLASGLSVLNHDVLDLYLNVVEDHEELQFLLYRGNVAAASGPNFVHSFW